MKWFRLLLLFNMLTLVLLIMSPNSTLATTTNLQVDNSTHVLIVYENFFDFTLATNISQGFTSSQYTLTPMSSIPDINDYFMTTNFSSYTDIVLIYSSEIQNMNDSTFTVLSDLSASGVSITLTSSKIWQISPAGANFFGITSTNNSQKEFNPTPSESYTLIIDNTTFFNTLVNYSIYQEIQSSSNIALITSYDVNSVKVISSSNVALSQNKTAESGFYIHSHPGSTSLISSIPISLRDTNDQNSTTLLTSVIKNIILYATPNQLPFASTPSSTTTVTTSTAPKSSANEPLTITTADQLVQLDSEVVEGATLLSGVAVTGYISYKIAPTLITKKEDELLDDEKSETWSPSLPIYFPLLALLIGIVTFFKATIYSKKFNRLTVFQVNENPIRQNIVDILEISGYEHFNSLQKKLKIGVSILLWHLQVMEEFNIVTTEKFGQYRVVFLFDSPPDPNEVQFYCNIRSRTAFDIIKLFLDKPSWSTDTLATLLYTSNDLVKYHCNKLQKLSILEYNKLSKTYVLNMANKEVLKSLLMKHPDVSN